MKWTGNRQIQRAMYYCTKSFVKNSMNAAFGVAQHMGGIVIDHEVDCYKAIQKAVDTAKEEDSILILFKNNTE